MASAAVAVASLWPAIWVEGIQGWINLFTLFSRFPWEGPNRIFGYVFHSTDFKYWNPFVWIPVILHPTVLMGVIAGWIGLIKSRSRAARVQTTLAVSVGQRLIRLSLAAWIALITFSAWVGVLITQPVLYDEERHLMFLYPPLVYLGALGLDHLRPHLKIALMGLVVILSGASYWQWGQFSYVYKSPLIIHRQSDRFLGDYWGLCVSEAVRQMKTRVPHGATVLVTGPYEAASVQAHRLKTSLIWGDPEFGEYRFVDNRKNLKAPFWVIEINRMSAERPVMRAIRRGVAQYLWSIQMPPGDLACVLAKVPEKSAQPE